MFALILPLNFLFFLMLFISSPFPVCSLLLHILPQNPFVVGHPFVDFFYTLHQRVGRIFFLYLRMSSFLWIVWYLLSVLSFAIIFWYTSSSFIGGCLFGVFSFISMSVGFPFLSCLALLWQFLHFSSLPHFPSRFCISVEILLGYSIPLLTSFDSTYINLFN